MDYDAIFDEVVKTSREKASEWEVEERIAFDRSRSISEVIKPISPVDLDRALKNNEHHHAPTLRIDTLTVEIPHPPKTDARTRLTELSQQMRTLLQSVIGYSEIIEEDLRAGDITAPLEDLATIRTASHRLLSLAREVEQQIDGERQKRRVAERLAALGEHALETDEPAPLYEALLEHLHAALTFDEGHLTLAGEDEPVVSFYETALRVDRAQHSNLLRACQRHGTPCKQTMEGLQALAIPLEIEGKIMAVITLFTGADAGFDAIHTGTAVAFTEQAARVLQTLAHRDQLSKRATYDNLTGLLNRATFMERSNRRCACDGLKGAIMLDIDHFKSINDTYGHAAGDMVLREVARRLCATVRGDDEIGRLGGEEFALVLARVLSKDAEDLAERLRMSVAARPFDIGIMHPIDVTVSVGVATGEDSNIEDLLARADEALYQAKRTGRNRVICTWSKAFQSGH